MRTAKVVGMVTAEDWGLTIERTDGIYTTRTISLDDGDYYIAGDGEDDDLLKHIVDEVQAAGGELSGFDASIGSTGLVTLTMGAGQTAEITWTDDATRDALGFSGAGKVIAPSGTASLVHLGGWYPSHGLTVDLPVRRWLRSVSRPDEGLPSVHSYATQRDHTVGWIYDGWYRTGAYSTQWHAYWDLWTTHIGPGVRVRVYPDTSEASAFDRISAPYGYMTGVVLADTQTVQPLERDSYLHLRDEWTLALES